MENTLGYGLFGKITSYFACALLKTKAKPTPISRKIKTAFVGENGLDTSGTFSLISGKWHKC